MRKEAKVAAIETLLRYWDTAPVLRHRSGIETPLRHWDAAPTLRRRSGIETTLRYWDTAPVLRRCSGIETPLRYWDTAPVLRHRSGIETPLRYWETAPVLRHSGICPHGLIEARNNWNHNMESQERSLNQVPSEWEATGIPARPRSSLKSTSVSNLWLLYCWDILCG